MKSVSPESCSIPGRVELSIGKGGLTRFILRSQWSEAEVYLHGAHITRFDPVGGKPLLWTSPESPFQDGKAIRGGVPVCFPWFGPHATKDFPMHGFARFRAWHAVSAATLSDGRTCLVLGLASDESTRRYWPYEFEVTLTILVGADLEATLTATNTGRDPLRYEECFHTYFSVGDVQAVTIRGFDGAGYLDRLRSDARGVQSGDIRIAGETTHIHVLPRPESEIEDPVLGRRILVRQHNMTETVVWNPGEATAAKNPEMAGFSKNFLCIEAATCVEHGVVLPPGGSHASSVRYSLGVL